MRYFRLPDDDEASPTPATSSPPSSSSSPFTMLAKVSSLGPPSASMIGSVRAGLGLAPLPQNDDGAGGGGGVDNSDTESQTSRSVMEEVSEYCPTMTYQQRIYGFIICFTTGYLMTFLSFRLFIKLVLGNPAPFVFLYTSGNIVSIASSIFLSGPTRQLRLMFDEKRYVTTVTYLIALCVSIVVCFIPMATGLKIGLLVLLLLIQMCANIWYTLSYIPYGRATVRRMIVSYLSNDDDV